MSENITCGVCREILPDTESAAKGRMCAKCLKLVEEQSHKTPEDHRRELLRAARCAAGLSAEIPQAQCIGWIDSNEPHIAQFAWTCGQAGVDPDGIREALDDIRGGASEQVLLRILGRR